MSQKEFYRGLAKIIILLVLMVVLCILVYDLAGMLAVAGQDSL